MYIYGDYWIQLSFTVFTVFKKKPSKYAHIYKLKQTSQRYCSVVINAMKIIIFRIFSVTYILYAE